MFNSAREGRILIYHLYYVPCKLQNKKKYTKESIFCRNEISYNIQTNHTWLEKQKVDNYYKFIFLHKLK